MKNTSTRFTTSHRNLCSVIFFGVSSVLRYLAFSQTSYANGWDGYFYINEVKSFIEEGRMDVPDVSLVYPLMMLLRFLTDDYVLSYKILCSILAGTFSMSLFLLALKWSENYKVAILLGAASLFSPHLTYFAAQYPKNLLGVIFFLWLLYSVGSKYKIVPIILLVLNFFGHRVTAVLAFIFFLVRKFNPYAVAAIFLLLVVSGLLLPGVINFFDIERFRGVVSGWPQFAPYSFIRFFGLSLLSAWWLGEIIACCVLFFVAIGFAVKEKRQSQLNTILLILTFLIFPFLEWSADGPALRFFLIFILLCPLLLIFLKPAGTKYFTAAFVVMSAFSWKSYEPSKHDPPYKLYDTISTQILSKVNAKGGADSPELIIAHKSLAEYVVYSTGIDAMSWVPEYEIEPERLWRIAQGVKDIQFSYYLDPADLDFVYRLTPSYSLVREDRWKKFIGRVEEDGNEDLLHEITGWKNPDKIRPRFLLKNK